MYTKWPQSLGQSQNLIPGFFYLTIYFVHSHLWALSLLFCTSPTSPPFLEWSFKGLFFFFCNFQDHFVLTQIHKTNCFLFCDPKAIFIYLFQHSSPVLMGICIYYLLPLLHTDTYNTGPLHSWWQTFVNWIKIKIWQPVRHLIYYCLLWI